MLWEELALRLGVATLLGAAIGLERQWRSHYVGLRTSALVAIGSAAMTSFGMMAPMNSDPSAIVHIVSGIITGIGFIGAGVIFHEGMAIKGFNTAATLWCSVAVGLFAGAGSFANAAVLAAFIIMVNLLLRPVTYFVNEQAETKNPSVKNKTPQ